MDEGLFAKYKKQINRRSDAKGKIIAFIIQQTGITLEETEISISGKKVSFHISSVKRTSLMKHQCGPLLESIGYTLRW
jgi:hypothetical protein